MMLLRWIDGARGAFANEATAAQVRHQQVTLLFQATLIGLPTGIMAALVVCLVLWQAVPAANLIGWALAVTVIIRASHLSAPSVPARPPRPKELKAMAKVVC
jgi:hypothetical protein